MPARLAIIAVIATVLFSALGFFPAQAQTVLTEDQLSRIKANCLAIKNGLTQLQASDALLRVNRGQMYEALGSKLMNNFNTRLANNSFDARGLQVVSGNYQTALGDFRSDYQAYERKLSSLIKIDCRQEPAAFHVAVEETRALRTEVHEDVQRLHQLIDDYRSAVNDFLLNFDRLKED